MKVRYTLEAGSHLLMVKDRSLVKDCNTNKENLFTKDNLMKEKEMDLVLLR